MTLSTEVYIAGATNLSTLAVTPLEVHALFNTLIGAPASVKFVDEPSRWDEGVHRLDNEPMQGLPAWLMLKYRPGAMLWPNGEPHDEDCEPDCEGTYHDPPCWLIVDFDTTYGYSCPEGGCGDLHTRLVAQLGQWLDGHGVSWWWRNEFTGEPFRSYEGLEKLGSGGREATAWFRNVVVPAIESGAIR